MKKLKELIDILQTFSDKDIIKRVVTIFEDDDVTIHTVLYNRKEYLLDFKVHNIALERSRTQKFGFQETLDKLSGLTDDNMLVYMITNKHYMVQFIFDNQDKLLISILGFKLREIPPGEKERRLAEANGEYLK